MRFSFGIPSPPAMGGAVAFCGALLLGAAATGCGDGEQPASSLADAGVHGADGGPAPVADPCQGFVDPPRAPREGCAAIDPDHPEALVECLTGSGYPGAWAIDDDGLPAYDLTIDQRCDSAGRAYSPRPYPLRDPVHLIGNGQGLVAMAHASGGVEIYSQDRGHKWINHIDLAEDPRGPTIAPALGGGFSYLVVDGEVRSTRFEDLPLDRALSMQRRRFGVGYVETETDFGDLLVRRRVSAPDAEVVGLDARALLAEVTVENRSATAAEIALIELWDVNIHQIDAQFVTSDKLFPGTSESIRRLRRRFMERFTQLASWDATNGIGTVTTAATALPAEVRGRLDPSGDDYFPEPIYLAGLDPAGSIDAVWLSEAELWSDLGRLPPSALADGLGTGPADAAASRSLDLEGKDQPALLALREPLHIEAGQGASRRFAFGYVPGGGDPGPAVAALRARADELRASTQDRWHQRLVWAAFDGVEHAGAVQREMAWSSYNALAQTTFDEYHGVRLNGQGSAYKFIHGLDGAIGDLCLFADSLLLIDPELARDTLHYAMATQHASTDATPFRYPYATTGVGYFDDVVIYDQRSDVYHLMPSSVARYVAITRDDAFLDREIPFWPRHAGEVGTALDHLRAGQQYATETLGYGGRGMVAIGTNDYSDGILMNAGDPVSPTGTSSTFNAGLVVLGYPLAAEVVAAHDAELAADLRTIASEQARLLNEEAWTGHHFVRGFRDDGTPFGGKHIYVEPQVLPILAGIVSSERRDTILEMIHTGFDTPYGQVVSLDSDGMGDLSERQTDGVWPVGNAWITEALASRDAGEGWQSFVANTLFAHAEAFPGIWYGIWTGPDSYRGPDASRAGEADAHEATAMTDYPAINAHVHNAPLRALMGILGIEGTVSGLRITPRVPTERFSVRFPRLTLESASDHFAGTLRTSAPASIELDVALPSGLRERDAVRVTVEGVARAVDVDGGRVRFQAMAGADSAIAYRIEAVPD